MNTHNDYADRFGNLISAYKPRPWGQHLSAPTGSKPEPISKTNLPKRNSVEARTSRPLAAPRTSIHDFEQLQYHKS